MVTLTSEKTRVRFATADHEQNNEWNGANSSPTLTIPWPYKGLFNTSRRWYQFTDLRRMDGLVSPRHVGCCQGLNPLSTDCKSGVLTTTLSCSRKSKAFKFEPKYWKLECRMVSVRVAFLPSHTQFNDTSYTYILPHYLVRLQYWVNKWLLLMIGK